MENNIYMINNSISCNLPAIGNTNNQDLILQTEELTYSLSRYFKNRKPNKDNIINFISYIKNSKIISDKDKSFATPNRIMEILDAYTTHSVNEEDFVMSDEDEKGFEEIDDTADHEKNLLSFVDKSVVELFDNIPVLDKDKKIQKNRFGTTIFYDFKDVWETLIYVANISSNNGEISFENIIEKLKDSKTISELSLNSNMIKDILNTNSENKFSKLFDIITNNVIIKDQSLVNKLLSNISKPLTTFKNIELLLENGAFSTSQFITNSTNTTDEKAKRYADTITDANNIYISLLNSGEFVWNIEKVKEGLFTVEKKGNYSISDANLLKLLKLTHVLKDTAEINDYNAKYKNNNDKDNLKKKIVTYFTEMFNSDIADKRFNRKYYNIPVIHKLIPENKAKLNLSFVTKTFKKMYAALNINHQAKMYRKYKQSHLFKVNFATMSRELNNLQNEDPTLKHLPFIKLVQKAKNNNQLEKALINLLNMSKLSIIDTVVENDTPLPVEELSEVSQLKFRLGISQLTYAGDITNKTDKNQINSFSFILPTNSSNKTVKVSEGIQYVKDIVDNKPVYAVDDINIKTTIINNEFNRIIHYFNKLVNLRDKENDTEIEVTEKINNIKIYSKNKTFNNLLNFYFCVSNQLPEINKKFFISKDKVKDNPLYVDMIKDIPVELYATLTKLPNLDYYTYSSDTGLGIKNDVAIQDLYNIYEKQFEAELTDLRKTLEKSGLVNFDSAGGITDMIQFADISTLINVNSAYLKEVPHIPQYKSDIIKQSMKDYEDTATAILTEKIDKDRQNTDYEELSAEDYKKKLNKEIRAVKKKAELFMLLEAYIIVHNYQDSSNGYSANKGKSLYDFYSRIFQEKDNSENSLLSNYNEIFNALRETIDRGSMDEFIANDYKRDFNSFNTEDYGVDNAFISKPIVLSDILDMLNKVNNGETAYKYHVVVEKGKLVLKVIAIEDLPLFGKEVYDKIVGMNYYNTLMNIYDDLNLTVGDMPSFFKGDADTGWNVATTFTNLYKRLKIIVSPTVPHAPHVILPNGKKETTFKNVVLKSHVTYTPQVRGTTINLNQKITNNLDTVYSDNFLSYVLGNNTELIQKVKDKAITLYEANGLLRREEQDILDKDFISLYKDNKNEINQELLNLGFDTSYFKVDLTDAFDMSTLSFELKRAMLYNTGNSTISNDMYNKLYNWLHEPMSTNENDTVKIGNFDTKVRRLRKHTSYNLDEFEELLNNNEKKDYDSFIFYLRKDITVDFVKDNYLNNRMIFTDKNSARVLLPTDIHGTPMDLIRLFMEVYDIGRMSHDSAIKMSSSSIYPIEFWNNLDDFNSQEDAFKFLFGELGGVETIPNTIVNNYVNVKWESMGEQVSQSESDKSLISSQSKTLVFLGQKYVPYTKLYYNGRQVDTPTITGKELYEKQQAIWKYIYYSKYQKFTDSIHINGVVNTEKLRETIIDSFAKTDKLKHNDMLSLNTKILNIIDQIKELILSTDNEYIKQDYVDTLKLIQEYINTDYNKRKQDDLDTIINKLIDYNFIDRLDASKENFLFEFILPLFYNTNSVKIESLFTSIINDLLRIKTAGVKGALTPNTDIIKTNFITGELLSSMVLVDPNDWTPELHLRSTSYADGNITSDEIATSWNFKGEVKDYYVLDEEGEFILSNDHFGNVSEITFKTEVFNTDKLDFTKSKNENVKEFTEELLKEICDNYSPDIHSNITIHYNKKDEIVAISLTRKEEGVLDILDYCKKDKHRISNGNNYIDYPVLDLNKLPKRILQGFANRIPTQSPNSMSYFNIVAFFHGKTKSTVAAPAEFIVRMGSDFDIDTLYSFIYNFMYNRKNKSFSFAEFTENEKELFDLWLVKNKLKSLTDKNISKNKPLGLKNMIKFYNELLSTDRQNIDKMINNLLFLLKDNDYFKSINIEQDDTFAELITKIVAYEKEVNDSITELSSMNVNVDTDIISTMKRNRLYLVNKKYKLSDCIDALFNEGVLQNMKNVYKEEFDKELQDNPDLVYDLNTEKSVYNRLTDNYISVMTNPLNLPSILAPLDFGISEGNATKTTKNNLIEALDYENLSLSKDIDEERLNNIVTILNEYGLAQTISLLKEDVNFTHNPLTVLTNYRKYIAALSSKAGIGWAALHQVFSTIVELKGQDVKYVPFENMSSEDIENMTLFLKDIDGKNIPIQTDVANNTITSEGKISGYEIKGQDRSTLVSILVDDETKQFAAKLNIVAFTFSAIAGYNVLGIDFTYYTTLLSNPIIKKLENLKTFYNGNEKAAYLELLYKSGLTDLVLHNPNNSYMPYSMSDDFNDFDSMMFTLFDLFKENKEYSSNIKDLLVLLNVEDYDNELANKKNIGILLSFYTANKLGKIWGEYAVTMNKDAAGLSSLYSKIVKQYEKLQDLFKNTNVQNLLQTFGDVDFLLYSPYIDNSVKRENDIVVYNSPYEFINFLKEFDETLNRYSINISINKISTLYNTVSFKNNMSVKEILSILINTDNAGEWIDLFKNGSVGNSFLYSLLDIYAKTIDSEDGDIIENDLISLIEYLLLPQRFKGIEQVNELLENMIEKSKYIDVYKKLVDYNKYIVNGNILFTPTSHKGYALKAVVLAIDTYHNYFPYATLLWKKYEGLYSSYNGKYLAYEDALSAFKKSFKTYQILSNSTSDNINIGKDKVKGLLMLKALKAINIVDNKSLYDKYPFLRDIDISVTENGYVIIEYTKSNNIISEAVNDNTKITRFEMMLKDNTAIKNILDAKKNPIDITIKDLAEYLAEYYLLANGANYSARNLGSLIPSTYMQNPDIAKNISFDFNEDVELSTTEKFDFLLFMFTHNPELFTNYTINIYDKEYFDESLNDRNVLIRKKPFEVNETQKNDLLYHRKDNKLYFNIVSVIKNVSLVNKILDFYLASSNKATISKVKRMLSEDNYPTAIYVKLNNFNHTTRGVTVYHIPTAKELTNKPKDTKLLLKEPLKNNDIKEGMIQEHTENGYPARTKLNAKANATIHLAVDFETHGERATTRDVKNAKAKYIPIVVNVKNLAVKDTDVTNIVKALNTLDMPVVGINIKSDSIDKDSLSNRLFVDYSELKISPKKANETDEQYQERLKDKDKATSDLKNQLYKLIVAKLIANPELIDDINKEGGLRFILESSHSSDSNKKSNNNIEWEGTKINSHYIDVLSMAYAKVAENTGRFMGIVDGKRSISINIAGNGIYDLLGTKQEDIDNYTYELLNRVINSKDLKVHVTFIRSGGQTGFDEAGIKAGMRLGIPTYLLAPKDWLFRTYDYETEKKVDISAKTDAKAEAKFKERFKINNNITDKENVIKVVKDAIATFEKNGKKGKAKNIEKDLVMINYSDGFIGKVVPETDINYASATEIYRKGWGNSANPTSFVGMKAIMISGSGTWNDSSKGGKITKKNIDDHFNNFYKPLIDKAVSEGVTYFNVGIAPGMDKVVTNYLVNVHRYSKHEQTVNNDKEIRWNRLKAPDNKGVTIQISDEIFTREQVINDPDTMYLFTDNTDRTSSSNATESNVDKDSWYYKKYSPNNERIISYGTDRNPTSALFRGLPNAYPISTMKKFGVNWTEEDYDLFVSVIDDEISEIKKSSLLFKNLHIGKYRIGQGGLKAKLPIKLQTYLDEKLKSIGIDNTGDTPKIINNSSIDLSSEFIEYRDIVRNNALQRYLLNKQYIDENGHVFENGNWYYFAEKAKKYAPDKYNSIVNAPDFHQAFLIGADRQKAYNKGKANTAGIQDLDKSVYIEVMIELVDYHNRNIKANLVNDTEFVSKINELVENANSEIATTPTTLVDVLTDKLRENPDIVEGITERGGVDYIISLDSVEDNITMEDAINQANSKEPIEQNYFNGYRPNSDTSKIHSIRPELVAKYGDKVSTFKLVKEGVRTRTTRLAKWMENNNPKVGDYFWQKNKKFPNDKVLTRITAVYGKDDPRFRNNWYKEGWIEDNFEYVKGYHSAIEFEVVTEKNLEKVQLSEKSDKVVETPLKGIQLVKNSMTNEEIKYVLDYIKPIIEETGFFANAATSLGKHANLMFTMGFSAWVPKRLIVGRENEVEPVWRITAQDYFKRKSEIDEWRGKGFTDIEIAEKLYDTGTNVYVYTLKNPDGSKIVPMSKKIYDILDRNFGIRSMGIYDSIIGNIYENSAKYNDKGKIFDGWITMIQYHEDTSEPYNNLTPIRVLVLGNEYKVGLDTNETNANKPNYSGSERPSKIITLKQGDIYEIGQIDSEGKAYGRYRGHMPFVTENTGINNNLPVKLPVLNLRDTYQIDYSGRKIRIPARKLSEYAVSLTFRSVALTELDNQQLLDISTKDLSKIQDVPNSTMPIQELVEAYNNVVKSENKSKKQSYDTLKKILIDKAIDKAVEKVVGDLSFKYLDFPSTMSKQEKDDITNLILKSEQSSERKEYIRLYLKDIDNLEDFNKAKIAEKNYKNSILAEDNNYYQSSIADIISEVEAEETYLFAEDDKSYKGESFENLLNNYKNNNIPEKFINEVETTLKEYGLYSLLNYNPNQLSLFDNNDEVETKEERDIRLVNKFIEKFSELYPDIPVRKVQQIDEDNTGKTVNQRKELTMSDVEKLFTNRPKLAESVYKKLGYVTNITDEEKQIAMRRYLSFLNSVSLQDNSKIEDMLIQEGIITKMCE